MRISEELDDAKISALSDEIKHVIERMTANDPELDHGEVFLACIDVIGGMLFGIECPGCRELSAHSIETMLPEFLRRARQGETAPG